MGTLAPHDNPHHLSTRALRLHTPSVHTSLAISPQPTAPVSSISSGNHNRFGTPITMNPQRGHWQHTRTSMGPYSELAHALIDDSIALLVEQSGVGEGIDHAHPYAVQVGSGEIVDSTMSAPVVCAWHTHSPRDLLIASQPMVTDPTIGSDIDAAFVRGTSRAYAIHGDCMSRTLEGCFEEREPFWPSIMAPPLGTNFATGPGLEETHLVESWAVSQSEHP